MNPLDLIKSYGFTRSGSCSCGGTRNEIYKKYDNKQVFNLYYRKTRHVFKIKQRNDVIIPITSLTNLETELKKLFPDVAVQKEEETITVQVVPG